MPQTFLEQEKPTDSSVSVLKRVDAFKAIVEFQQIVKALFGNCVILCKQFTHLTGNVIRLCGFFPFADHGEAFYIMYQQKPYECFLYSKSLVADTLQEPRLEMHSTGGSNPCVTKEQDRDAFGRWK